MGGPHHHSDWIKLAEWAEMRGINVRTAQRMFHRGEIDSPTRTSDNGRLYVKVSLEEAQQARKKRQGGRSSKPERTEALLNEILDRLDRLEQHLGIG